MNVLQTGLMRSGNFWIWKIIELAGEKADIARSRFISHEPLYRILRDGGFVSPLYRDIDIIEIGPVRNANIFFAAQMIRASIANLEEYTSKAWHVWTHSLWNAGTAGVYSKFDRIVCIVRDPRDVLASYARFQFSPLMEATRTSQAASPRDYVERYADEIARRWVQHVGEHLKHREEFSIRFVLYERLLRDFSSEAKALLDFLGFGLGAADVGEIAQKTEFSALRAQNPDHFSMGGQGGWRSLLAPAVEKRVLRAAGPLMEYLGYGTPAGPGVPATISAGAVDGMIRRSHRRPLPELLRSGARNLSYFAGS